MKGLLLAFEGIDGSGKSTQARLLHRALVQEGRKVRFYREPGGTLLGERIRKLLLQNHQTPISMTSELLLYLAARAQLLEEKIRPALRKGEIVLLDRYFYSTAAYQGQQGDWTPDEILTLCGNLGFERPDRVFLLDADVQRSFRRGSRGGDRIEKRGLSYFQGVRKSFLRMAKQEPRRFSVLNALRPIPEIRAEIREAIDRMLAVARPPRDRYHGRP